MLAALSGQNGKTDSDLTQARGNAGALIMAEAFHELYLLRRLLQALIEGLSK